MELPFPTADVREVGSVSEATLVVDEFAVISDDGVEINEDDETTYVEEGSA